MKNFTRKHLPLDAGELGIDTDYKSSENQQEVLENQISDIQLEVATFGNIQAKNEDKFSEVSQSMANLFTKLGSVEEQLHELEHRTETDLGLERRELKKMMELCQKNCQKEIDQSSNKLTVLEKDNKIMTEEVTLLKRQLRTCKFENDEVLSKLEGTRNDMWILQDKNKKLEQMLKNAEKFNAQKTDLINTLHSELEQEKEKKTLNIEHKVLERQRLTDLKTENQLLTEKNEELKAKLVHLSLRQSELVPPQENIPLAEELKDYNEKELIQICEEERIMNERLHHYIEEMLLKIIQHYPKLLEIV